MIFVAAGTKDGRELADFLQKRGFDVMASAVTEYGSGLLKENPALSVNNKPLDLAEMTEFLRDNGITIFVDATHPYARNISQNAITACAHIGLPYIRYERPAAVEEYENIHRVSDYESAARKAGELGQNIFLTTGSRSLPIFVRELGNSRLIARVLPSPEVIAQCFELKLCPKSIIAMQGPFSQAINEEMFRHAQADVVVTKNSGTIGGTDTKLAAAAALALPVVMIDRPPLQYPAVTDDFAVVAAFIDSHCQ